jgi:hypothetical protein
MKMFNFHFQFAFYILHFLSKFTRGLHRLLMGGSMTKTVHCTEYTVYTMKRTSCVYACLVYTVHADLCRNQREVGKTVELARTELGLAWLTAD